MGLKQLVKRQTLTGQWTEINFEKKSRSFLVKNYTDGDIYVSFTNNDEESESVKIAKGMCEEVAITFYGIDKTDFYVNSIYIKGSGEVEVQALDTYIHYEESEEI